MKKNLFVVLVMFCAAFFKTYSQTSNYNSTFKFNKDAIVVQLSENVYAEILPEMELLSGVLSQTPWIKKMGPMGEGNKYFQRLKAFFQKYKEHEAVEIAEDITDDGFNYDAPPGFILQLNPLPELNCESMPEYYNMRAGGKENLEEFRKALKNIYEESGFIDFFKSEKEYLKNIVDTTIAGFDAERITKWLNEFFGYKGDEFHIVFAPAMFPGGGYGAQKSVNNKEIVFQVIRDNGSSQNEPFFCRQIDLLSLTFHEFGHSFINPAIEEKKDLLEELELEDLYEPVEDRMRKMAYSNYITFLNELHIRAMTIIAMEDYTGASAETIKMLSQEKDKGFYLIDFTYNKLKEYKDSRNMYPTFKNFLPDLLKEYSENKSALLELAE